MPSYAKLVVLLFCAFSGAVVGCGDAKKPFDVKKDGERLREYMNRVTSRTDSPTEISELNVRNVSEITPDSYRLQIQAKAQFLRDSFVELKKDVVLKKAGWNSELIRTAVARLRNLPLDDVAEAERLNPLPLVEAGFYRKEGNAGDELEFVGNCVARRRASGWDFETWVLEQTHQARKLNDTSLDANNLKFGTVPAGGLVVDDLAGQMKVKKAVDQMASFAAAVDRAEATVLAREEEQWKKLLKLSTPGHAWQVTINDSNKTPHTWLMQFVAQENQGETVRVLIRHSQDTARRRIYEGRLNRGLNVDKGPFERPPRVPPQIVLGHGGGGPSLFHALYEEKLTIDVAPNGGKVLLRTNFDQGEMIEGESVAFAQSEADLWNDWQNHIRPGTQWQGTITTKAGTSEQIILTFTEVSSDFGYVRVLLESMADPASVAVYQGYMRKQYVYGWPIVLNPIYGLRGNSKIPGFFNAEGSFKIPFSLAADGAGLLGIKGDEVMRLNGVRRLEPWPDRSQLVRKLFSPGARLAGRVRQSVYVDGDTIEQRALDVIMTVAEFRGDGEYVRVVLQDKDQPNQIVTYEGNLRLDRDLVDTFCLDLKKRASATRDLTLFDYKMPVDLLFRLAPDGAEAIGIVRREKHIVIERLSLRATTPDPKTASLASVDFTPLVKEKLAKGVIWRGPFVDAYTKREAFITMKIIDALADRLTVEISAPKFSPVIYEGAFRIDDGTINGYCVGEPWNQAAVFKGIGVPVITDYEIWKNNPEKVFGITAAFAEKNPNTVLALTKALIRAAIWLDENANANRAKAVEMLSKPEYVGADKAVIANSMTGTFEYEKGDKRAIPDFNVFFRYFATYPYYSDAVWYLTQMRRWGQIPETKDDAWYHDTAKSVYRPDLYLAAAKLLVADGKAKKEDFPWDTDGYRAPTSEFIDGVTYDGRKPNAYIDGLKIGLKGKQKVSGAKVVDG